MDVSLPQPSIAPWGGELGESVKNRTVEIGQLHARECDVGRGQKVKC